MPASGLFTADRSLKENPQMVKRTLRALIKANRFIADNRQETIAVMLKWLPQTADVAARSYDLELKGITPDGQMTDAEMDSLVEHVVEVMNPTCLHMRPRAKKDALDFLALAAIGIASLNDETAEEDAEALAQTQLIFRLVLF